MFWPKKGQFSILSIIPVGKMKILSFILFLYWFNRYCHAFEYRNTWYDFDEARKQWVKEGKVEAYTREEEEEHRKAKRDMEMSKKYSEYLIEGMRTSRRMPTMITAYLDQGYIQQQKEDGASDLTWDQLADLCDNWLNSIKFVVEEVVCYPSKHESSITFIVKHHSKGDDVWKLLLSRTNEIGELSWDEKIAYPSSQLFYY